MVEFYSIIRAIHIISGSIWIGEFIVINFIFFPILSKYQGEMNKRLSISFSHRIFNFSSILSIIVVVTGVFMIFQITNGDLNYLLSGRWGLSILIGSILGIILTIFHFTFENRLIKKIDLENEGDDTEIKKVILKLKIVIRIGIIVTLTIFLLMLNAYRSLI